MQNTVQKYEHEQPLLLGSMYFRSWLIQLNMSFKYNESIARTGISTLKRPYLGNGAKFWKIEENKVQLFRDFEFREVVPKHF